MKLRKIYTSAGILLLSLFCIGDAVAKDAKFETGVSFGSTGADEPYSSLTDKDGNYYISGTCRGDVEFAGGATIKGRGGMGGGFFYKPVYTGYLEDKKKIRRESTKYGVMQLAAPAAIIILCELAGYIEYIIAAPSGETYMGWRVYVFGIAGRIIAAVITRKKVAVNSVTTTVYTFVSVFILYGGLMNLAAMFMSSSYQNGNISISLESLKLLYITGIPYDAMHALGAAVCVFLFGNTLIQKMTRIRIKYGLVSDRG